jgi:hypothetical protein
MLYRASELLDEGDPGSAREVIQAAIAACGRQPELLWALADAEFAEGDCDSGREHLDEAVAASPGDPSSVARQIRALRLGKFWREALSIVQGLSPQLRADPLIRAEVGDFFRACDCPAHAFDAYASAGGLPRAARTARRRCWLRQGGPSARLRGRALEGEVRALDDLSSPASYIAAMRDVEGLSDRQAQRVRAHLETYMYLFQRRGLGWRAMNRAGYRLVPLCLAPAWLVLLAAAALGNFQPGSAGTGGFAAVGALVTTLLFVAAARTVMRPDGLYRFHIHYTVAVAATFAIVALEATAGAAYSRQALPEDGWWAAATLGAIAAPAALLFFAVAWTAAVDVPYVWRNRRLIREDPQTLAIDSLLFVLHELRSPRARQAVAARIGYCRQLEFAARCLTTYLLPAARLSGLGEGTWLAGRAAGWAEAIRFTQRQVIATLPERQAKTEALLTHDIRCLATGNLGALAWRRPAPAPARVVLLRRRALAVGRAVTAAALPLAAVLAVQPFIHATAGVFTWARVLAGAWALLYVLLSIDPTMRDKIGTARDLAGLLQAVPGPTSTSLQSQYRTGSGV